MKLSTDRAHRRGSISGKVWIGDHSAEVVALARSAPFGPPVATYRTSKGAKSPESWMRFDSIWVTRHWAVRQIDHLCGPGLCTLRDD
jgi:hypothetical protein